MDESIIVAIITGGCSIIGVVLTCLISFRKTQNSINIQQAVIDTKIEELTREVREHNGFAKRMPVVEEQIKVMNHRIKDLESLTEKIYDEKR